MKRKDNRGFTLLELIVAVVILGLIVAPLLHSFLTSANITRRSRATDAATNAVSNLIEDVKAQRSIADFLDLSLVSSSLKGEPDISPAGIITYEVENYTYGTRTFNGTIMLDPTPYREENSGIANDINDRPFVKYSANGVKYGMDIDSSYDLTVLHELAMKRASEEAELAYQAALAAWSAAGGNPAAMPAPPDAAFIQAYYFPAMYTTALADLTREIKFSVYDEGDSLRVDSTMVYKSNYNVGGMPQSFEQTITPGSLSYLKDPAIYLFYYPLFGAKADTIVVRNNPGRGANIDIENVQLFLVKQRPDATLASYSGGSIASMDRDFISSAYPNMGMQFTLQQHYGANRATLTSNVALGLDSLELVRDDLNYNNNTVLYGDVEIREQTKLPSSLVEYYKNENRMYNVIIELTDTAADGRTIRMAASKLLFPEGDN